MPAATVAQNGLAIRRGGTAAVGARVSSTRGLVIPPSDSSAIPIDSELCGKRRRGMFGEGWPRVAAHLHPRTPSTPYRPWTSVYRGRVY